MYYLPKGVIEADLALMRQVNELYPEHSCAGARMLRDLLWPDFVVGLKHVGTLTQRVGIEAAEEAIQLYATPDIFNTDHGCQFSTDAFTGLLKEHGIAIRKGRKGNWRDNVFVERLCRSMKYEEVYLRA